MLVYYHHPITNVVIILHFKMYYIRTIQPFYENISQKYSWGSNHTNGGPNIQECLDLGVQLHRVYLDPWVQIKGGPTILQQRYIYTQSWKGVV